MIQLCVVDNSWIPLICMLDTSTCLFEYHHIRVIVQQEKAWNPTQDRLLCFSCEAMPKYIPCKGEKREQTVQLTSRKLGFSLFDYSDSFSWLDLLSRSFCDSSFLNTTQTWVVLFPLGWKLMSHSLLHIVTFPSTSGKGPALCPRLVKYQLYNSKAIQKKSLCSCFLLDIIYNNVLLFRSINVLVEVQ